jgi:ABC-2 type transport system permease protein
MAEAKKPAKGKTAAEALITAAAVCAALICLNAVTCKSGAKLDLTEGQVYTLSSASKMLVASVPESFRIKAYFGGVPAEHAEKMSYVDMLLAEYAEASNGKISYEKIDPTGNEALEKELAGEGVSELKLQSRKGNNFEEIRMYFHVVFEHLDKKEVWVPDGGFTLEGLEYDFTTRIKRLAVGKKKVAVTTGFGEPPQAQWLSGDRATELGIRLGLGDLFEVTPVDWSKDPQGLLAADVIIVNGPQTKVSDAAKLTLDQAIMDGKGVLFLVQGMSWQAGGGQQQQMMMQEAEQPYIGMPGDGALADLLAHYGFEVGKDVVMDVQNSTITAIPPGGGGKGFIGFAPAAKSLASGEREILAGIQGIYVPFASSLKLVGPLAGGSTADLTVTKLLETPSTSFLKTEMMAITEQYRLGSEPKPDGPHLVAAAVSGKWRSFYSQPPVGVPVPEGGLKAESPVNTRIAVVTSPAIVADTTLADIRITREIGYVNGFVAAHNLVDWLAEETDLVAVRAKKVERRLVSLEDGTKTAIKMANLIGPPVFLIGIGLLVWRLRERRRKNITL